MFRRLAAAVLILAVMAALLVAAWPQLFGLQRTEFVAQVVSLRGAALSVAVVLIVVLLVVSLVARSFRSLGASLSVLLLVFVGVTAAVLSSRGIGDGPANEPPSDAGLTVLSWNTLGPATPPAGIAQLALEMDADIISLPETRQEDAIEAAVSMREAGKPMWVLTRSYDKISPARSTSLLVSVALGEYEFDDQAVSTAVLPTIVATPVDGSGPTIVAVHAVAPIPGQMQNWRDDLALLAGMCSDDNVIMAGDFNATIDHFTGLEARGTTAGTHLGECTDAAALTKTAAVGTWPTALPGLLGAPIDHVLVTDDWNVDGMRVITDRDDSGSDHRPIVAWLSPRE